MTAQPGLARRSPSRYRIVRRLGAGGMGTVFLAVDRRNRPVALKVLHEHLRDDPVFRRRFTREVQVAARVAGPGTARVLDAEPDSPTPYLVTEYVPGDCLHDRVDAQGPLRGAELYAVAHGVATALVTIHRAGVVHRDLKPRNVMLSSDGPKVIDFGVAGAVDRETILGFGTPGWLAPEQLAGQPGGTPADVYAWALLVTWAGTGMHPAHHRPQPELLPEYLRPAVRAALAADPMLRPTATDLVSLCAPAVNRPAHPQHPVRPARPGRLPRTTRRRRLRIGGRVVTLALLTALLVTGWQLAERYGRSGPTAGAATEPGRSAPPAPPAPPAATPTGSKTAYAPAGSGTVRDGGLEFTLTGLRCGDTELGSWPVTTRAKGQFCQADVRVTNIGQRTGLVVASSQTLVDTAGGEHGADDWAWIHVGGARAFTSPLDKGDSVAGTLVFDVPRDVRFTKIVVHDTPLSGGASIALG